MNEGRVINQILEYAYSCAPPGEAAPVIVSVILSE